ncbi:hypothetical protein M3M33_13865, partial [Loigolactobacillus coryniformis]|uniref:hypothetical protein n=1 Tax=Loigolactobacillus coryniformis TaxID=1610 RepID=UPI00201A649E
FQALMTAGHDEDFEPTTYGPRTLAGPGSLEKVEVMRRRVELGQHLFHPGDEQVLASHESACVMSRTVQQISKMRKVS